MATARPPTRLWRSVLQQYVSGRPLHDLSRRTFTTSTSRSSRHLPRFEPSSSEDLDALLSLMRSRILMTGLLNPQQQELVFHEKWRSTLENEPVYATVGGEEVQLQHLDRFRDMPNRWASWNKAIDLAHTDNDWRNMVRMLEGYKAITRGKGIEPARLEKWVRKACENGQTAKVLQCLRAVRNTGVSLRDHGIAFQVFVGCVSEELRRTNYSKRAVKSAWTRVMDLLELLEMPEHCGGRQLVENDVRQQPWVLGVVVEASSLYYKQRWPEGDGPKEELQTYVDRLLQCASMIPLNTLLLDIPDTSSKGLLLGKQAEKVAKLIPLWHGLGLAEEILRDDAKRTSEMANLRESAASLIEQLVEELEQNKRPEKVYRPVQTWQQLTSSSTDPGVTSEDVSEDTADVVHDGELAQESGDAKKV